MQDTPGTPGPHDPDRPSSGPGQPPHGQPPYWQVPAGQPPFGGYPPPTGYGYSPPGYGYSPPQDHPNASTAMVLGIIAVVGGVSCGLPLFAAPFAWWLGAKAKREIDAAGGQWGGRGNAQAGFVLGIIGTVLLVLGIAAIVVFVILGVSGAFDETG